MQLKINYKYIAKLVLLFSCCYLSGSWAGHVADRLVSASVFSNSTDSWGLSFQDDGQQPIGNVSAEVLKEFRAFYVGNPEEKTIYLTFDVGYENGNTEKILNILKTRQVPATFFVLGHFIKDQPNLLKRMIDDGHIVGNHTYSHPDMSKINSLEAFKTELEELETQFKSVTGKDMIKFYRPPQGKYNEENLKMAKSLGYTTFFWSLAYVDWIDDDQPPKEEAFERLIGRIHPGAIVLLHSTSTTNASILNELIDRWTAMGYTFGTLQELASSNPI